ncbi:hypothetical protein NUU61_007016 [Penicillium alfredii]|uniref:Uncharacterized protein n=1 Tax=Penicillium alfredii TaxID=1506179 RepID=A0A9W9K4B7_9EURO|nr:uncharacterized protein NUU61_007016 [Penicillium alfredii]KAJ5092146.1 hypothetical protein NUU61_007016 [Penicillium alfredii]
MLRICLRPLTLERLHGRLSSSSVSVSGKRTDQAMVMELVFSRLLSLLVYHPNYSSEDLDESTKLGDLSDFSRYLFYLSAVSNERNLSLIVHVAQCVKQVRNGITKSDEISTRLHTLSDLAQATIRRFADIYSQQHKFGSASGATNILQMYLGKIGVPSSLFASMSGHQEAQDVADKNFLPDEMDDLLDRVVCAAMKPKSSSSHGGPGGPAEKRKPKSLDANGNASATKKARRDKDKSVRPAQVLVGRREDEWSSDGGATDDLPPACRRSGRGVGKKKVSYADNDSDEDDIEMQKWNQPEPANDHDDAEEETEDEEMPDDEGDRKADGQKTADGDEPEKANEKEDELPTPSKQGARVETKANRAKQPTTTTLPTRRSSRRG